MKKLKMTSASGLPYCDTPEADGKPVDRGMSHGELFRIRTGVFVDTVRCERCGREFQVSAEKYGP